jgi:hypothetical protein
MFVLNILTQCSELEELHCNAERTGNKSFAFLYVVELNFILHVEIICTFDEYDISMGFVSLLLNMKLQFNVPLLMRLLHVQRIIHYLKFYNMLFFQVLVNVQVNILLIN